MFSAETAIEISAEVISEAIKFIESEGAYIRPLSVDRVVPKTLPVINHCFICSLQCEADKSSYSAALTETGSLHCGCLNCNLTFNLRHDTKY